MTRTASLFATLLLLAATPAATLLLPAAPAAAQTVDETIGTWRLACASDRMTDRTACSLIHQQPAERSEPGRPSLALEIIDRGGRLVPAVTARDLTLDNAARGLLAITGTVQMRFPPNRLFEIACGLEGRSLICAPRAEEAARAEQELAAADRVLIRVVSPGGGGSAAEPVELPLAGTRQAMESFRRLVPPSPPAPAETPLIEPRELMNRFRQLFN
ncbi:MAG: hypothetical protein K2X74_08880 [Acetobacteraceae bacterium]|nr:hypothetical protein [Acetobacteraceae bacterium]